ncbi:MAG: FAD:protein FMN transferase [Patescibacteria group bacterium]
MKDFTFKGLGTVWSIIVDGTSLRDETKAAIVQYVAWFEKHFSRFLPGSEVNMFRESPAGDFVVSKEFALLLATAGRLRTLTDGAYDPAVGTILETAGYGGKQGLKPLKKTVPTLPQWSLADTTLTIDGPIAFDLGGIGKGYCIDKVANILRRFGCDYYLVDGGGDMAVTTKADGSAWRVAIEYPGKPDTAASLAELSHQGLAVSDSFRRKWGKWHHLIDAQGKKPIEGIIGCAAVAPDTWAADRMTSGLFFAPVESYPALAKEFAASYLIFRSDGTASVSPDWGGEIFN